MQINVHEAKTHFSKLLARVSNGEEIIISKAGKPVALLMPIKPRSHRRKPGSAKGKIIIHDTFTDPLPADTRKTFEE
jgi:prevent-host-death family protein